MKTLLQGKEIIKSFGQEEERHLVLDNVSLNIEEGEFVSVMGPSGSGKSTLLYTLSGMDSIDKGSVTFAGKELCGLSEDALSDLRRTKMGFVFQEPTLLKNLNILDNILLPAMRENRKNLKRLLQKARGYMKQTGIEMLEHREINQVSGGQLQRVGICRALMSEPKIIFGDEPTGALNSKAAQEIMGLFQKINENGTTVLLVTHDVHVAAKTKRILFMLDGKIASEMNFSDQERETDVRKAEKILDRMRQIGI